MDRMSPFYKRCRIELGVAALCAVLVFLAGACDNPVDLLAEMETKVMIANDRFLKISAITVPLQDGTFSPTGKITIVFDRPINFESVSPTTVVITRVGGGVVDYPMRGVAYQAETRTLTIRVYPFLEPTSDFILKVDGVIGADGSRILVAQELTFSTRNGFIVYPTMVSTDAASLPGYSTTNQVNVFLDVSAYYAQVRYRLDFSINDGLSWSSGSTSDWLMRPSDGKIVISNYSFTGVSHGAVKLRVVAWGRDSSGDGVEALTSDDPDPQIIVDTEPPTAGSIIVSDSATYALSPDVTLTYSNAPTDAGTGLYQMRFSNNGVIWSEWRAYESISNWNLVVGAGGSSSQGTRSVYAEVRDRAGNISASSASDTIIYDTVAPSGGVWKINSDATYSGVAAVTIAATTIPSDATSGIAMMSFSNNNFTWSSWEAYNPSIAWNLVTGAGGSSAQGNRFVYVRVMDNAGNISSSVSDSIVFDTSAPNVGVWVINSNASFTNNSSVSITASTAPSDSYSGIAQMRFSNNNSTWSAWQAYSTSKAWNLSTGEGGSTAQGTRYVYVQVMDGAGNISGSGSDAIVYDISAPNVGAWRINSDAAYTNSSTVTVSVTVSPSDSYSGIANIRFSNNGSTWSAWQSYSSSKSWSLTTGEGGSTSQGIRTVYVQVRDGAGNESVSTSDSIHYDNTAPTGTFAVGSGNPESLSFPETTLYFSISDNSSGVTQRNLWNGSAWMGWESYTTTKYWMVSPGNGTKVVYAQFRDAAGNVSGTISDSVVLSATYGSLIRKDIALNRLTLSGDSNAYMSNASINLSDGYIAAGQLYTYYTNAGRYGKFEIVSFNKSETAGSNVLTINLTTYNADGTVYSQKSNLKIRGTWSCDLDSGLESSSGADFWWRQDTSTTRYLVPQNGALFFRWK